MHVAIVGAGLLGLSTAHYLRQAGAEVSVFEREVGPGLKTSFANGSLLHPSLVEPWNSPGVWRVLLQSLADPEASMRLHWNALPSMVPWGWRFLRESSVPRFRANALANVALAHHSLRCMHALEASGVAYHAYRRGSLVVMRSPRTWAAARAWREWLEPHGVAWQALSVAQAVDLEPALRPIAVQLVGATLQPGDEGGDPQAFCQSMSASLQAQGVRLAFGCGVRSLVQDGGQISGLALDDGSSIACDRVVLCTAAWTPPLARSVGVRVPVQPVKGYSLTLPRSGGVPGTPLIDADLHVGIVAVGEDRARVVGMAEFAGWDATLDPARVALLHRFAAQLVPEVMRATPPHTITPWTGLRPVSPDGVALIGATRMPGLYLNTGHGHTGWTCAAASGDLLACQLLNLTPAIDPRPYDPRRFE